MSTPQTPPTPSLEDIKAASAASQATPTPGEPPAAAPPEPAAPPALSPDNPVQTTDLGNGRIKVEYLTGEVFEGTPVEIAQKMGQAHVSTKLWAKQKAAEVPIPAPPAPEPSLFAAPEEQQAAEYVLDLQAKALGFKNAEEYRQVVRNIQNNNIDYSSQTTALQFQAMQPDYNPTPENNAKLMNALVESGVGDLFDSAPREKQVQMLRQAHAFCLMTKAYEPKPATTAPPTFKPPTPTPTLPAGSRPADVGQLPENLRANPNDTLEQIREKWEKAKAMGLA